MWRRFINDDECAFVRIEDDDDDDDDISGWNERKQITVSERTGKKDRIKSVCKHIIDWRFHMEKWRVVSLSHVHTHTNIPMPATDIIHTYILACKCWYECLAMYRIRKLMFFSKRKTRSLPAKTNPFVHGSVRLSFILSFFRSDFIRFRLQFTYGREIGFCARECWSAPQNYIHLSCFCLFTFISICSAQLWHITFPSVWFVSWKPTNTSRQWMVLFTCSL